MPTLDEIIIRTELVPGDLGHVIHLHGLLYAAEYGYGIDFESYVAAGLHEFWDRRDPMRDAVWLCEHERRMVGTLFLVHRENNAAQLRYFLIEPACRGCGLGRKLMGLFMNALHARQYESCFLWTTHELTAAASLYVKHGFVLAEEKESNAFGKNVREQRYDLILGPAAGATFFERRSQPT